MIENQVMEVPVESIILENHPYENMDIERNTNLDDLLTSIKHVGILNPLLVRSTTIANCYILLAGRRRLRAAKEIGKKTVPIRICKALPDVNKEVQDILLAAIENECRVDMNPVERALMYKELIETHKVKGCEVAIFLGKTEGYISRHRALLSLPQQIINALMDGKITPTHGFKLLELKHNPEQLMQAFKSALDGVPVHKLLAGIQKEEVETDEDTPQEEERVEEEKEKPKMFSTKGISDYNADTEDIFFDLNFMGSSARTEVEIKEYVDKINTTYSKLQRKERSRVTLVMQTLHWIYNKDADDPLKDVFTRI